MYTLNSIVYWPNSLNNNRKETNRIAATTQMYFFPAPENIKEIICG